MGGEERNQILPCVGLLSRTGSYHFSRGKLGQIEQAHAPQTLLIPSQQPSKLTLTMLDFPAGTESEAKCRVTHGVMGHLDPRQPPVKRKPFAEILNHGFVQKVCDLSYNKSSKLTGQN